MDMPDVTEWSSEDLVKLAEIVNGELQRRDSRDLVLLALVESLRSGGELTPSRRSKVVSYLSKYQECRGLVENCTKTNPIDATGLHDNEGSQRWMWGGK